MKEIESVLSTCLLQSYIVKFRLEIPLKMFLPMSATTRRGAWPSEEMSYTNLLRISSFF
jgi:hypothetical protein